MTEGCYNAVRSFKNGVSCRLALIGLWLNLRGNLNNLDVLISQSTTYIYFFILVASEGLYYSLHIFMLYNDNQLHHLHTYMLLH